MGHCRQGRFDDHANRNREKVRRSLLQCGQESENSHPRHHHHRHRIYLDHAHQQLNRRTRQPKGRAEITVAVIDWRKTKARKYSYDAVTILQIVWSIAGGIRGKYLASPMEGRLYYFETHRDLIPGEGG